MLLKSLIPIFALFSNSAEATTSCSNGISLTNNPTDTSAKCIQMVGASILGVTNCDPSENKQNWSLVSDGKAYQVQSTTERTNDGSNKPYCWKTTPSQVRVQTVKFVPCPPIDENRKYTRFDYVDGEILVHRTRETLFELNGYLAKGVPTENAIFDVIDLADL